MESLNGQKTRELSFLIKPCHGVVELFFKTSNVRLDMLSFSNDFVNSVCPCAGLSQLNSAKNKKVFHKIIEIVISEKKTKTQLDIFFVLFKTRSV